MQAKKRILTITAVLVMAVMAVTAYAASHGYSGTVQKLINVKLDDGYTRSSSTDSWTLTMSSSSQAPSFTGYLEAQAAGTTAWVQVTNEFTIYSGQTKNYVYGRFIPKKDAIMRMYAKRSDYGPATVSGTVDYN